MRVRIPDPESHLVGISCVTMSQLPALCEPGPALNSAVSIPTILAVGRSQFSNVCKILASTWNLGKPGEWALSSTSCRFPSLLGVGGKLVDTSLSFATLSKTLGLWVSPSMTVPEKGEAWRGQAPERHPRCFHPVVTPSTASLSREVTPTVDAADRGHWPPVITQGPGIAGPGPGLPSVERGLSLPGMSEANLLPALKPQGLWHPPAGSPAPVPTGATQMCK